MVQFTLDFEDSTVIDGMARVTVSEETVVLPQSIPTLPDRRTNLSQLPKAVMGENQS